MKKGLFAAILLLCFTFGNTLQAQYVTIPDANFATWLQTNYPQCMQGNQMDTTCSAVITDTIVNCQRKSIVDLTGIQYFDNLTTLWCRANLIVQLGDLPPNLKWLFADSNRLTTITAFPPTLTRVDLSTNLLSILPIIPNTVSSIQINHNSFSVMPILPNSIVHIECTHNQLTSLLSLPPNLEGLYIGNNLLTGLPTLPVSMEYLVCPQNRITILPALPPKLKTLICNSNLLTSIPILPDSLRTLNCGYNSNIPLLPNLPPLLETLLTNGNGLQALPTLPSTLKVLGCVANNITVIPELPPVMINLAIGTNPISCLPQLKKIDLLDFPNTNITCLPNYGSIATSNPPLSTLPLCGMFNNNGCPDFYSITGKTYFDADTNCSFGSADVRLGPVKIQLFSSGQLVEQAFTGGEGFYSFDVQHNYGTYQTSIDSSFLPFTITCPDTGYYTSVISASDSVDNNLDFGLKCKQGFDLGVYDLIRSLGWFRPASYHTFNLIAGDVAKLYGASCAAVPGQVKVILSGPASVQAYPGLTPSSVNGDTIIWSVSDFRNVSLSNSFLIQLQVDTFALSGSLVCFDMSITPTLGDNNPFNNKLFYCYQVQAAYDPNNKEVFPSDNIDTTQHWLTYTINFQNTGNAPAQHVFVMDTLDANVDVSSIQLLSYSHDNYTQVLENGIIKFNFPNINLPDSTSNEPGSHGFVRYKIKLNDGLPIGTTIENTAHIYFDFNAPIVTNTTLNRIVLPEPDGVFEANRPTFNIYPNPASSLLTISASFGLQGNNIAIYDLSGKQLILEVATSATHTINTSNLANGLYLLVVKDATQQVQLRQRIVIAQ